MSNPLEKLRRRSTRPAPRPRIVDVTNRWQVRPDGNRREVIVRDVNGAQVTAYLPDSHPALVRFLDRLQAAAAAA